MTHSMLVEKQNDNLTTTYRETNKNANTQAHTGMQAQNKQQK